VRRLLLPAWECLKATTKEEEERRSKRKVRMLGFEPLRAEPNGFRDGRLNHSAKVSVTDLASFRASIILDDLVPGPFFLRSFG